MNALFDALLAAALGQAPSDAGTAASEAVRVQSVWDFVVKGGPMMVPLGICSLVAVTVMIERLVMLRYRRVIPRGFLPGLTKTLEEAPDDRSKALDYCTSHGSPVASVFAAGIKRLDKPVEVLERHVQEAGSRVVRSLRKNLRVLSVVASIAPLMGLLGTIFGMIKAFQTVAVSPDALGKTELLAKGIYEAMITTAAGLLIAIPVLVGYHYLTARISRIVADIDQMTVDFIEEYACSDSTEETAPKIAKRGERNGADESDRDEAVQAAVA